MTFALVRREPSQDMLTFGTEAWLCELAMEDRAAANWRAMVDSSEPPTDAEIDRIFLKFRAHVDREEALKIATAAGQMKPRQPGQYDGPELFSEDLW